MEVGMISSNPFYSEWLIDEPAMTRGFESKGKLILKSPQFNCFRGNLWNLELQFASSCGTPIINLEIKEESCSNPYNEFDFTGSYTYFVNYQDSSECKIKMITAFKTTLFENNLKNMKENFSSKGIITLRFFINATRKNAKQSSAILTAYPESNSENLYNKPDFSDVQLSVGGVKFYAHKAVLANSSPVFAAMFRNEMMEKNENLVEISDFTTEVVENLLSYIYAGKIKINESIMYDLSNAAEKYQISGLKTLCANYLHGCLTVQNSLEMISYADKYNMQQLKQKIFFFIGNSYNLDFINSQALIDLEQSNLKLFSEIAKYCMQAKVFD